MKKLVTILIIVLPIIFVVALFAVTSVASLSTSTPPLGLEILNKGDNGKGTFYFDMADYGEEKRLYEDELQIVVQPEQNKNVQNYALVSITDDADNPTNIVSLEKDENDKNYFALHNTGTAIITYAALDNNAPTNHTASVQFVINASKVLNFTPVLSDGEKEIALVPAEEGSGADYKATIKSGSYLLYANNVTPQNTQSATSFASSNENSLEIDEFGGAFDARFSGTTDVTFSMGAATKVIRFEVYRAGDVTVDGADIAASPHLLAPLNSREFSLWLETKDNVTKDDISLVAPDGTPADIAVEVVDGAQNAFKVNVALSAPVREQRTEHYTLVALGERYELCVDFANYSYTLSTSCQTLNDDEYLMLFVPDGPDDPEDAAAELNKQDFLISSKPRTQNVTYKWRIVEGGSYVRIIEGEDGAKARLAASRAGEAKLQVTCTTADGDVSQLTYKIVASPNYTSIAFSEIGENHGKSDLAIASDRYKITDEEVDANSTVKERYELGLEVRIGSHDATEFKGLDIFSDLNITLSDPRLAELETESRAIYLHALETGSLEIDVSRKYGDTTPVKLPMQTVKGVAIGKHIDFSGVVVEWEQSEARDMLMLAMEQKKAVVLGQDVYLGEPLYSYSVDENTGVRIREPLRKNSDGSPNYSWMSAHNKMWVKQLPTTWDWTFYKNSGMQQPNVNYALEITANIYGNGHQINAEYVTNTTDATGKPLFGSTPTAFNGPLNFVAASDWASVKGQDNIVFLVREAGLTVDNVVLKSCDDESLREGDGIDLSLLQYMGTTLEVMNDFTLTNSFVRNGRTVMRVYGKDGIDPDSPVNAAEEKIKVNIKNCDLSVAREFVLKIGTNRSVRGGADNPSPSLFAQSGKEYEGYNTAACDARITPGNSAYDEDFVNNFVLTEVVLEDSVLSSSGLFTIGMESHFAGSMLAYSDILSEWHDLAGTSYPAVLRLVGNVELKDWKELRLVDSSTLIESPENSPFPWLALNIQEMLKVVKAMIPEYAELIAHDDATGIDWVHGGIAMYGGGKNYHGVDMSRFTGEKFSMPTINISVLTNAEDANVKRQGEMLPLAAGTQDFRFFMYDSNSNYGYNKAD